MLVERSSRWLGLDTLGWWVDAGRASWLVLGLAMFQGVCKRRCHRISLGVHMGDSSRLHEYIKSPKTSHNVQLNGLGTPKAFSHFPASHLMAI